MGRSRLALCVVLAAVAGCKARQEGQQSVPPPTAPQRATIRLDAVDAIDTSVAVRDLFTRETLTFERRGFLMVLLDSNGIIDTLTAPSSREGVTLTMMRLDSSFVQFSSESADTLAPRHVDLICVANGRLHWSARLPALLRSASSSGTYAASFSLLHSPVAISGDESYSLSTSLGDATMSWRHRFELRFDDSARAFTNVMVALDSVPFADDSAAATGRYPGIALRIGTNVLIDGRWYSLSLPEDLDPVEFAQGTVGLVLEGKGEWGDTLRSVTARPTAQ